MRVLSLFDGISCAKVAMDRRGIQVDAYYASEVDKHAIKVSQMNHPYIHHVGDVRNVRTELLPIKPIDLLIGGSPRQDLSIANAHRKGLEGERSGLFYEYVRIKEEFQPKWWVLENVASMSKEARAEITKTLGVEPLEINAALVSPQIRRRLFWTNIPVSFMPADRGLTLKDILQNGEPARFSRIKGIYHIGIEKALALNSSNWRGLNRNQSQTCAVVNGKPRPLTPIECERLMGLPDNYTLGISKTQRLRCLGNAFHVEVVGHILSFINKEVPCF